MGREVGIIYISARILGLVVFLSVVCGVFLCRYGFCSLFAGGLLVVLVQILRLRWCLRAYFVLILGFYVLGVVGGACGLVFVTVLGWGGWWSVGLVSVTVLGWGGWVVLGFW